MLTGTPTVELPMLAAPESNAYQGEELAWFDAEATLAPTPQRVERPTRVHPAFLAAAAVFATIGLAGTTVAIASRLLPL